MRVLGVDPGTNVTGYGLVEGRGNRYSMVSCGEIKLAKEDPFSRRLEAIYERLSGVIRELNPDVVSLEDIFYGKNVKSLIKQGHARGVIILAASHGKLPVYEYSPLEIKKAVVGYGRADKMQVQIMVRTILNLPELLPPDASDALAIAICHSNFLKTVCL